MTQAQKTSKTGESDGQDYRSKIFDLLDKYEGGREIFRNAYDWDQEVKLKPEYADDPSLPSSERDGDMAWLNLIDKVIGIIAHDKYELDTYENSIEIIDADQMLEAYTKAGMPIMYDHWSFGKQRVLLDRAYEGGQMGLAYEIIINTAPAIAYCMEQNSKTMQALVIAHASYGHNSFFKGNHLFQQFTKADEIIPDMRRLRDKIRKAEDKYGYERVEKLIDACHALESHSVDKYTKPKPKTKEDRQEIRAKREEVRRRNYDEVIEDAGFPDKTSKKDFDAANDDDLEAHKKAVHPSDREENILMYLVKNAPHLEPWEREIMELMAVKAQYFYPQRQTQVMNEGWASFWHYTLMNELNDMDLIDESMMTEFLKSHTSVIYQPMTRKVQDPETGEIKEVPTFSQMNVYALGFAIFQDIKRICTEPTEEDKQWFPDIAGNGDWLGTIKDAMHAFKDESFILQYLSPKVIRDFRLFALSDHEENPMYNIDAIHDDEGYREVRQILASNYRLGEMVPQIFIDDYDFKGDRTLTLKFIPHNDKPLEEKDMNEVLKHIHQLWQHNVRLKVLDSDGDLDNILGCPPPEEHEFEALFTYDP